MEDAARAELAAELNKLEQNLQSLHDASAELIDALRLTGEMAAEIEEMLKEGRRALD